MERYNRIILGAGMYGLYAANRLSEMGYRVLVIDCDKEPMNRGSYVNQARLHNGYHYPRSYATASKSAKYFRRFLNDYRDCINTEFTQIYAIAKEYSWTNAKQFVKFCNQLNIRCETMDKGLFFNEYTVEEAYVTEEFTFDALLLKEKLYNSAQKLGCEFRFGFNIKEIKKEAEEFVVTLINQENFSAPFVLNATYAGTNQIHALLGYEQLPIKYELCEVILCEVSDNIKDIGLTVMDGPFFSIMPFGKTGYHSLTTVSRTPHITCYDTLPTFECQKQNKDCLPSAVCNCNECEYRPQSSFVEMYQIAKKYLKEDIEIKPVKCLFTLKPILKTSEIDDSRPTVIRQYNAKPDFYTVFSGKINTMYDLDDILR